MNKEHPLRALVCEDSEEDCALLSRALRKGGYSPELTRVDTQDQMAAELRASTFDAIFSDWSIPGFGALDALVVYAQSGRDIPFIVVSGTIGEDVAVSALRAGAHDFVPKSQLARLVPALERELREVQVRSERNKMREQLLIADRMASMGTLAAGVAHEINNPLAALIANAEMAKKQIDDLGDTFDFGDLAEELQDVREAAERIRAVVRDLKVFSRSSVEKTVAVDVQRVLESTLRMAWNEVRHRARLVKTFTPVPLVEATESRLGQLLLNLVMNAAQAIPEGRVAQNQIRVATGTDPQGRVVIEIADTGVGMPPEVRARIFTPFFTTKPEGVGTGLGLSICQRIASELGGFIEVESTVGVGTTFRVVIPPASAELQLSPGDDTSKPATSKCRGKVLVVDDEVILAKAIERTLSPDHEVTTLSSAEVALGRVVAGERFDVIVCDVMMPQMTGIELFAELSRVAPDQAERMIFLTGGAFTHLAQQFLETTKNLRLEKPFDTGHLRKVVNERVMGVVARSRSSSA
jgi:signal transduction histidine kinase